MAVKCASVSSNGSEFRLGLPQVGLYKKKTQKFPVVLFTPKQKGCLEETGNTKQLFSPVRGLSPVTWAHQSISLERHVFVV